jgi:hypothetical protein
LVSHPGISPASSGIERRGDRVTNASRHLRPRVVASWLIAAVLVLAVTSIGAASSGSRSTTEPSGQVTATAHLTAVLEATVSPVTTAAAAAHSQTPRQLPISEAALTAAAVLILTLTWFVSRVPNRRTAVLRTLPSLRGPPYRLLSR